MGDNAGRTSRSLVHSRRPDFTPTRTLSSVPEKKIDAGVHKLVKELAASKKEQAEWWRKLGRDGGYELAYHKKPTQRDLEMEIRERIKGRDPEVIRWELASLVGGPLSYE